MRKYALALLTLLFVSTSAFSASVVREKLKVGDSSRELLLYVPNNLPYNAPLLISLHGMNQDAEYQRNQCSWEPVADTAKFVVVFPEGEDKSWDIGGNKDIEFLEAIIENMNERFGIDKNRVYLSGFSMGAMMTYHAASKIAEKFAALAPVSGYNMSGAASATKTIPLIHTHGTADDVCTYGPVPEYVEKWVKLNNCNPTPVVYDPYPKGKPNHCTLKVWTNEETGVEVALLTLDDKGHWHSNDGDGAMTSKEIWNFIKKFNRGPTAPRPPEIASSTPADGWFNLPDSNLTIEFTFSEKVDPATASAKLYQKIWAEKLVLLQTEPSETLTFKTAPGVKLAPGAYTFTIQGAKGEAGGTLKKSTFVFTVGSDPEKEAKHCTPFLEALEEYSDIYNVFSGEQYSACDIIQKNSRNLYEEYSGFSSYSPDAYDSGTQLLREQSGKMVEIMEAMDILAEVIEEAVQLKDSCLNYGINQRTMNSFNSALNKAMESNFNTVTAIESTIQTLNTRIESARKTLMTGVESVECPEPVKVEYFTISGGSVAEPTGKGIYLKRTFFEDGSVTTNKFLISNPL